MVNTRFFRDEAVVRNGLDGWQTEMLRNFQGREYYVVHWMFATNGLTYLLNTFGPPDSRSWLKDEAERMCSSFEMIR